MSSTDDANDDINKKNKNEEIAGNYKPLTFFRLVVALLSIVSSKINIFHSALKLRHSFDVYFMRSWFQAIGWLINSVVIIQ